ncbi:MAG: sterol desaturase family protein [Bdellovibrionaceae bacterium]|nr:sterol desaturase family protein [Pseudobdellovibrionaceae bacterium]
MLIKSVVIGVGFLCFTLWEKKKPFAHQSQNSLWTNLSLGLISASITSLVIFTGHYFYPSLTANTPIDIIQVLKTVILLDIASYTWHLLSHKIPWLWRLHQVHHSEINMTASSAFRFHFVEVLISLIPRFAFIYYFSLPLETVVIFEIIFQLSNMYQHSNIALPHRLDRIAQFFFVTPTMHRYHHALDPQKQMTNFSTIFSIWDKMMDTYEDNFADNIGKLGLAHHNQHFTLKKLLFFPFR